MVKDLWRVGMENQYGQSAVYYDGIRLESLPVAEVKSRIKEWQNKPHYKMYPTLFRNGDLCIFEQLEVKGMRLLVKEGLINSAQAYQLVPSMKAWLKRMGFWVEEKKPEPAIASEVTLNGVGYARINGQWCLQNSQDWTPLPSKAHFRSAWEARVKYASGQATLHEIAEYGWGPLLEVIGDIIYRSEDADLLSTIQKLTSDVEELQVSQPALSGFTQKGGLWIQQFKLNPLNPLKKRLFWDLFTRVCSKSMSGYAAHLRFINAFPRKIKIEDTRWKYYKTPYCPLLIGRQVRIDSCRTLGEARDLVQKIFLAAKIVGFPLPDEKKIYFYYKHNRFGLWLDSGKIFFFNPNACKYIPKDFDKWDEAKQRYYLGADYETQIEKWNKQSRLARRLYFYLKHEGVSSRKAWLIAQHKYQKLSASYVRRIRASGRWACYYANLTAKTSEELLKEVCA